LDVPLWQNAGQREPTANLTLRVRAHLDRRLARQVFELNEHGWRTSKVEIIEMLLYEMDDEVNNDLVARLSSFRSNAPRHAI
jgi:predicted site-specific integrase-resolvase